MEQHSCGQIEDYWVKLLAQSANAGSALQLDQKLSQGKSSSFDYKGFGGFNLEVHQCSTKDGDNALALTPLSELQSLSKRPVFQSPYSPNEAHPVLPQPCGIGPFAVDEAHCSDSDADNKRRILSEAIDQIDHQFRNPKKREESESSSFTAKTVEPENLWGKMRRNHSTLGVRGLIAATDLRAGFPLVYSHQYVPDDRSTEFVVNLALAFQSQVDIRADILIPFASHAIESYSWTPNKFKGLSYFTNAFAAGNAANLINHDDKEPNMNVVYLPTVFRSADSDLEDAGKMSLGPTAVVYYTNRDVSAGEQLLVNYGANYAMHNSILCGKPQLN